MNTSRMQRSGFTLVELAIIIVVMAILFAITIISYGSWRIRVDNDVRKNDAAQTEVALKALINFDGAKDLAARLSEPKGSSFAKAACVGQETNYPAISAMPDGACVTNGSVSTVKASIMNPPVLEDAFESKYRTNEVRYDGSKVFRGTLIALGSNGFEIYYLLSGDQDKGSCSDERGRSNTSGSALYSALPQYFCVRTVDASIK